MFLRVPEYGAATLTKRFEDCNRLLAKLRFLLNEHRASGEHSRAALRLLYTTASFFLIAVDYSSRSIAHLEAESRVVGLAEGFRYGNAGKDRAQAIVDTALKLFSGSANPDSFTRDKMEDEVRKQLADYPAELLAEYFAKPEVAKGIFVTALEFDANAYGDALISPRQCSSSCKSLLAVLCDFFKIDRREII
jgi:hypothetical protein